MQIFFSHSTYLDVTINEELPSFEFGSVAVLWHAMTLFPASLHDIVSTKFYKIKIYMGSDSIKATISSKIIANEHRRIPKSEYCNFFQKGGRW